MNFSKFGFLITLLFFGNAFTVLHSSADTKVRVAKKVAPIAGLTELQKVQILNVFNQARATTVVPAADMKILKWDENIAKEMQSYTDDCANYWVELDQPPAFFAYRDHALSPVGVAKWRTLRMAPYYDYETGGCIDTVQSRKICRNPGNYENIVYSSNERVGCGVTRCAPGKKGVFHACAIGIEPDNGDQPTDHAWKSGPRCSACPQGWNYCIGGLCSKEPAPKR